MHSNDAANSQCENRFSLHFVSKRLHFHPAANTQSMRKNAMRHDRVGDDWLIGVGNCRLKRLGGVDWEADRRRRYWRSKSGRRQSYLGCAEDLLSWLRCVGRDSNWCTAHVLRCRNELSLWSRHRDDRSCHLNRRHRRVNHLTALAHHLLGLRVGNSHWIDDTRHLHSRQPKLRILVHEILVRSSQLGNLKLVGFNATLEHLVLFLEPPQDRHDVVLAAPLITLLHAVVVLTVHPL